jgi:penicillin G amidase
MGRRVYDGFTEYPPLASRMVRKVFLEKSPDWLGAAKPDDILRAAFTSAVARGVDKMGHDPTKWQWGDIHRTVLRHPLTERSRFLELVYHVGPVALPGSSDTVNVAGWSKAHPFHVNEGVSLRQVAEMTAPPTVFGVSPMGSSAHFFSVHYKDQMGAWIKGNSFRDPVQRSDIRKHGFNAVHFKSRQTKTISRK